MLKEIFKATAHPKMKSTLPHVPRNLYDELCAIFKAGSAYYRATVIVFNSYFEFVHLALLVMFVIFIYFLLIKVQGFFICHIIVIQGIIRSEM